MKKLLLTSIALFAMMMAFGQDDNARFAFINEQTQKWGFMDRNGNVVIEPQFEEIHMLAASVHGRRFTVPFKEGMAAVQVNGKWGFINTNGKMVIKPHFEEVSDFEDGVAYGFIEDEVKLFDKTGEIVDNIANYMTKKFLEGTGMEYTVDEFGGLEIVNKKTGEKFDDCALFSEGLARVTKGGYALYDAQVAGSVSGYIDMTGKVVIPLQFGYPSNDFHEGLASVSYHVGKGVWKMGFIDKTGRFAIEPQYQEAGDFHEGMAAVQVDDKCGFIDKTGKMVIPPQFYGVGNFSDGLALFVNFERKQGFIDKSGEIILGPYDAVLTPFEDGLALVGDGDDMYYIDKSGKRVLNAIR